MYRHGDVGIFRSAEKILKKNGFKELTVKNSRKAKKLIGLVLAEGEVTGHAHRITEGEADLYEKDGVLYLSVKSDSALLTHEEHKAISIPIGDYEIRIQKEYEPEGWRNVQD